MLALGAIDTQSDDLRVTRKPADGCIWADNSTTAGAMSHVFHAVPCPKGGCEWDKSDWHSAIAKNLKPIEGDNGSTQERVKSKIQDERLAGCSTKIDASKYILRQAFCLCSC